MKIYLDLVIILNFILDLMLLISVNIILKRNAKFFKLFLGGLVGGVSILLLFIKINNIELFFVKLIISIVMIIESFGYRNFKYFLKNLFYLYMSSIVLGGFLYFLNFQFSNKHVGIIFINKGISINLIFVCIVSPIIMFIYIKQSKLLKYNCSFYYDIYIYLNNKEYKYVGYMDSGNVLIDFVTGKKVILIDKRKILFDIKEFRLIPYMGVSGEKILKVIKLDKIKFNGMEYYDILLGIVENISFDGVDIILNGKLMEE